MPAPRRVAAGFAPLLETAIGAVCSDAGPSEPGAASSGCCRSPGPGPRVGAGPKAALGERGSLRDGVAAWPGLLRPPDLGRDDAFLRSLVAFVLGWQ